MAAARGNREVCLKNKSMMNSILVSSFMNDLMFWSFMHVLRKRQLDMQNSCRVISDSTSLSLMPAMGCQHTEYIKENTKLKIKEQN